MDYETNAWDCDPFFIPENMSDEIDLDVDDSADSDWQVIALDRWGDAKLRNASRY